MRIFIGIKLDNYVLDTIEAFLKPFKKISSPIKWVKNENLHITLKFLGEVSPQQYSKLETRLSDLKKHDHPIDLKISGCGKFGKENSLNILWIGIQENIPLGSTYSQIRELLSKIITAREDIV